jgi:hypothetical protein
MSQLPDRRDFLKVSTAVAVCGVLPQLSSGADHRQARTPGAGGYVTCIRLVAHAVRLPVGEQDHTIGFAQGLKFQIDQRGIRVTFALCERYAIRLDRLDFIPSRAVFHPLTDPGKQHDIRLKCPKFSATGRYEFSDDGQVIVELMASAPLDFGDDSGLLAHIDEA